jgi:hypothetical protein
MLRVDVLRDALYHIADMYNDAVEVYTGSIAKKIVLTLLVNSNTGQGTLIEPLHINNWSLYTIFPSTVATT